MLTSFAERIRSELEELSVSDALRARWGEWLEADKTFNVWFLDTTKRALADDELLALLEGYRESQELAETGWETFLDTKDEARLFESIASSIHRMELVRQQT